MTSPQGWYQDPGGSNGLRWYDGERWTEHVAPPGPLPAGGRATTTPDGRPLAGWGRRLGAYLLDGLAVAVVANLIGLPWLRQVVDVYVDYLDDVMSASSEGRSVPPSDTFAFYGDVAGPILVLMLIQLVVSATYHVGSWRRWSASPAMLLLGLRVRLWEQRADPAPGAGSSGLPWGPAVRRWGALHGAGLLGPVPLIGTILGIYVLLAGLWPLWDARRQGLHDKAAGTVVVRVARA